MGKKKKYNHIEKFVSILTPASLKKVPLGLVLFSAFPAFMAVAFFSWLFSPKNTSDERSPFFPPHVNSQEVTKPVEATPTPHIPTPALKDQAATSSAITARSAIAVDVASGAVLYTKDEKLQLWPASTTKVMTALVALGEYQLDAAVLIENPVATGSIMGLVEGERITVENLLYGILIQSANDAAYALADFHPDGRDAFVDRMNEKAHEIGLENTHFYDPAGFDNDKQYTTASDLAKLSLFALKNKTISRMVSIPLITVSDTDFLHFHPLKNVNQLLGAVPGVAGVKTGWTENAKENLINLTKRNGVEVLTVILGSEDRFGETQALTEWVFGNFIWSTPPPTHP